MKPIDQLSSEWAKKENLPFWHEESTTSTNDVAKDQAHELSENEKLYLTGHQSAGRGRNANSWEDSSGGGYLLSSWSFRLDKAPQHIMGPVVGVALFNAVRSQWPNLEWSIKAPNDLYLKDKKIGGLLVETLSQGDLFRLVIGLGLNVYDHPVEIDNATHLISQDGTGQELSTDKWFKFLNELRKQFRRALIDGTRPYLSESTRETLLIALNQFPLKPYVYLEVTEGGDLVTDEGTVSWHQL